MGVARVVLEELGGDAVGGGGPEGRSRGQQSRGHDQSGQARLHSLHGAFHCCSPCWSRSVKKERKARVRVCLATSASLRFISHSIPEKKPGVPWWTPGRGPK